MKSRSFLFLIPIVLSLVSCNSNSQNSLEKVEFCVVFDENEGSISGSINGLYTIGTSLSIIVTPNEGYEFNGIYNGETLASVVPTYSFVIEENTTLNVLFKEVDSGGEPVVPPTPTPVNYEFSLDYDTATGRVSGTSSGTYEEGTLITLDATPNSNYEFIGYYNGDNLVSSDTHYEFSLTSDIEIDAFFKLSETSDWMPTLSTVQEVTKGEIGMNDIDWTDTRINPKYSLKSLSEYYENIDFSLIGEELKDELREVTRLKSHYNYDYARSLLQYTDESLEDPGYIFGIYDGTSIRPIWDSGHTWNREHIWCQSRYEGISGGPKSDLFNLRAASTRINSSRGNNYYDEKGTSGYYPNENEEYDFRGDVARSCFYVYTNYEGLRLTDNPNSNLNVSMGKLSTLLRWHKEDPVDEFERQRNMKIYQFQGNRNPYVDIPELVDRVFIS